MGVGVDWSEGGRGVRGETGSGGGGGGGGGESIDLLSPALMGRK